MPGVFFFSTFSFLHVVEFKIYFWINNAKKKLMFSGLERRFLCKIFFFFIIIIIYSNEKWVKTFVPLTLNKGFYFTSAFLFQRISNEIQWEKKKKTPTEQRKIYIDRERENESRGSNTDGLCYTWCIVPQIGYLLRTRVNQSQVHLIAMIVLNVGELSFYKNKN